MPANREFAASQEIDRRSFLRQLTINTIFLSSLAGLIEEGSIALDSPFARFFLEQPYQSPILSPTLQLTQAQVEHAVLVVFGMSYAKGEGGNESPTQIAAKEVKEIGNWEPVVVAQSGSYLSDIPAQLENPHVIQSLTLSPNHLFVTDGGYNSVVLEMLKQSPNIEDTFTTALSNPANVKLWNELAEIFFLGLETVEKRFPEVLATSMDTLQAEKGYVYSWPPLELVRAIVHIPHSEDPNDNKFSLQVKGSRVNEIFAKQISILGSNMVIRSVERVRRDFPARHSDIAVLDLRKALTSSSYVGRRDEHANEEGQQAIADLQLSQTTLIGERVSDMLGRREK